MSAPAYALDEQFDESYAFELDERVHETALVEEALTLAPAVSDLLAKVRKGPLTILRTSIRSSALGVPGYRVF